MASVTSSDPVRRHGAALGRPSRSVPHQGRMGLIGLVALVVAATSLAAVGGHGSVRAASDELLIADNMNRRLVLTDFAGNVLWTWDNPTGGTSPYDGPLGVVWLPGNQILATFGTGEVGLLDPATRKWIWKTKGFGGDWFQSPYDADLLPDGNLAVALRYNSGGECVVYDHATGAVVWRYLLSNAHVVRYEPSSVAYNSPNHPAILCGGWGQTAEVTYDPGAADNGTVTWSVPTEYTHDALHVENGYMLTTEGYYIQKIDRLDNQIWKVATPDEERRIALNPSGGYIYSVLLGDRIEFRDTAGQLTSSFSRLSDGTTLDYPYGIAVTSWTPPSPTPSPTSDPSSSPAPSSSPSPSPSASPSSSPSPSATPNPSPSPSSSPSTLFTDGFESGDLSRWTSVRAANGGTVAAQSTVVHSGSFAAALSETSASGSVAYARKSLQSAQTQLTVVAAVDVAAEGAAGSNVPLIRLFDANGNRVVSLYRQNGTGGQLWVAYGASYAKTSGTVPLGTWATVSLRVAVNGSASTVAVALGGTTVYSTAAASLGPAPVSSVQIGDEVAAQAFTQYVDDVHVTSP